MVDRPARDMAAQLTREWRDGALTNDALEDRWPTGSSDRALRAVGSMLWRTYDDHREHVLEKPSRDLVVDLDRYIAFLEGDLPYEWSKDRFDTIDWLTMANRLTLGLVSSLKSRLRRRCATLASEGDLRVWPYRQEADIPETHIRQ